MQLDKEKILNYRSWKERDKVITMLRKKIANYKCKIINQKHENPIR